MIGIGDEEEEEEEEGEYTSQTKRRNWDNFIGNYRRRAKSKHSSTN